MAKPADFLSPKSPPAAPAKSKSRVKHPKRAVPSAAEYLAQQLAQTDALFSSIGEGVIVTDTEGKISRINDIALNILRFDLEDVLGKWYPGTIIAEDADGVRVPNIKRPIAEVFLTGKPIFKRVFYRRKDGSRVAIALTVSPVLLNNKPIGGIEVFRDITEELRLEKAKDEFISLASHQLRTPATAVKQYAGMLLQGYAGNLTEAQMAMAKNIFDSNERQINTINDLLRVAQIDAGQVQLRKRRTALIPLLQDIINEQYDKFKDRDQQLLFEYPKREVWAVIDEERMRMVLENIIDNAGKYTLPKKKVFVSIQRRQGRVRITVKDQGVGIATKDIAQIFEKFTRLDNPLSAAVGGTGLGLYWAKKILDLHGADLFVESKARQGSTFTIVLK